MIMASMVIMDSKSIRFAGLAMVILPLVLHEAGELAPEESSINDRETV